MIRMISNLKQKQLFANTEQKIKPTWFRNWFHDFFNGWNFTLRISGFIIITIICAILFFVMREEALKGHMHEPKFNAGMGLSFGENWDQSIVYFLKIFISLIFISLSLIMNKWYLYLCFWTVGINSLFNVIDKGIVDIYLNEPHYDTVVDYIYWAGFKFTNNIADIFIVTFVIVSVLLIIVYIILMVKNDNKKERNDYESNHPRNY